MNSRFILVLSLSSLCLAGNSPKEAANSRSRERIRHIILHSRHLGAHGMGYNEQSLNRLSRKLFVEDIPTLIDLLADNNLNVGVQFALASQCSVAIAPVREAAAQHQMSFIDAEDTMRLIENFPGCTIETQQRAAAMRSEIHQLADEEQKRAEEEAREKAAEDARIQRNALRLMDPEQAKQLTRTEREEVYRRSLKAMGLTEHGPMTQAQKDLVQRMYRTIVLGESGNRPPN